MSEATRGAFPPPKCHRVFILRSRVSASLKACQHRLTRPFEVAPPGLGTPEMTGQEAAQAVDAPHPGIPVVPPTGWGAPATPGCPEAPAVDHILGRPARSRDLPDVVATLRRPREHAR